MDQNFLATLGMTRLFLHAGRLSQATLQGKVEKTIESLYLTIKCFDRQKDLYQVLGL
ncbi:hypothetical protein D934_07335 [Xylella fastidiosa subsp. sandyi Ann-1]|uniref:Uncharacterized protein n=1 Tax=Xylella fastidiosa subsp. sandyi Ann-1 TaxID=155920 RepID=A0A060H7J1_XYLFS|nr:hypothetical protein D934_07335 [Xylella fastidiosa subsp. sandyi Ann-1]